MFLRSFEVGKAGALDTEGCESIDPRELMEGQGQCLLVEVLVMSLVWSIVE